jgi:hypothetical protein
MARIINFPSKGIKPKSILSDKIKSTIDSLPDELAECLSNSFSEICSFPIVKQKSFNVVVPSDLQENDLSKIKESIEIIIKSYQDEILPVLKRLSEKEAELCMLRQKINRSPT